MLKKYSQKLQWDNCVELCSKPLIFRRSWRQTPLGQIPISGWCMANGFENTCERNELDLWLVFFCKEKFIWKGARLRWNVMKMMEQSSCALCWMGSKKKSDRATSVEVEGQGYWRLPVHKTHALAFLVRSISLCNFGEISGMVVVLRSWFIKCDSCDISKTIYHPHHYYYYHSHYQSRYPLLALWLWSLLWKPSLLS